MRSRWSLERRGCTSCSGARASTNSRSAATAACYSSGSRCAIFYYVKKKLHDKRKNIKNYLLDQKFVSGIGNIYASEILFESKINPKKKSCDLSDQELRNIVKYSNNLLKDEK